MLKPAFLLIASTYLGSLSPQDAANQSALIEALFRKDAVTVQKLLKAGADPNSREILISKPSATDGDLGGKSSAGRTALDISVDLRSVVLVKTLLTAKADPNARSPYGWTPLISACQRDNLEIVKLLLKFGAKPNLRNVHGDTAIIFAANVDRVQIVETLITSGADMNGGTGQTALIIAAMCGSKKSVELLLAKGADPNFRRPGYSTPLEYAHMSYDESIAQMIRKAGGKGKSKSELDREERERLNVWEAKQKSEEKARSESIKQEVKFRDDDAAVLEAALVDLATYKGDDFELSWGQKNKNIVLFDETIGRANEYTESQMNSELDERKANDVSLEMRRDFISRNSKPVSLKTLKLGDARILIKPENEIPLRWGVDFDKIKAIGWVRVHLPGYSSKGDRAFLRFGFGPTPHGASGTFFLEKKAGKWVVRWRDFAHYV